MNIPEPLTAEEWHRLDSAAGAHLFDESCPWCLLTRERDEHAALREKARAVVESVVTVAVTDNGGTTGREAREPTALDQQTMISIRAIDALRAALDEVKG